MTSWNKEGSWALSSGEGLASSKLSWLPRYGEACAEETSLYVSEGVRRWPLKAAMLPHSFGWPYAALGSSEAWRECDGEGKVPWVMFGEAFGLGLRWFMAGSRCGGVGECGWAVAIWFISSEGLMD